jgi:hypothetical protein
MKNNPYSLAFAFSQTLLSLNKKKDDKQLFTRFDKMLSDSSKPMKREQRL